LALIVQKYGGSSLATPEKIRALAERIVARYDKGDRLVIVVSAMGNTTNQLEAKANALSKDPDPREVDMLISIGERESISLVAIAINSIRPGLAISFTGSQIGLITDNNHRNARILEIKGDRLVDALGKGKIPIIAGFQGVSIDKQITTLGRGGSDTTAVAVTAAIKADACEIYSDVIGVYSADPKICDAPVLIKELDYETMLTISSLGAKVLKDAAVEYAHRLGVKITTGLTWTGETGTTVSAVTSLDRNKFFSLVQNDKLSYFTYAAVSLPRRPERHPLLPKLAFRLEHDLLHSPQRRSGSKLLIPRHRRFRPEKRKHQAQPDALHALAKQQHNRHRPLRDQIRSLHKRPAAGRTLQRHSQNFLLNYQPVDETSRNK
jgi:aspartate kinase